MRGGVNQDLFILVDLIIIMVLLDVYFLLFRSWLFIFTSIKNFGQRMELPIAQDEGNCLQY